MKQGPHVDQCLLDNGPHLFIKNTVALYVQLEISAIFSWFFLNSHEVFSIDQFLKLLPGCGFIIGCYFSFQTDDL